MRDKYRFVVPADTKGTVSDAYGAGQVPTAVVVGRDVLMKCFIVEGDPKALDDEVGSARAEPRPPVSSNLQPGVLGTGRLIRRQQVMFMKR